MQQLTKEEKAKVVAIYFNVPCVRFDGWDKGLYQNVYQTNITLVIDAEYNLQGWRMHLTPLSGITDEHAIEVAKIRGHREADMCKEEMIYTGRAIVEFHFLNTTPFADPFDSAISRKQICDLHFMHPPRMLAYLISKGYDVPQWFGVGHWANGKTAIQLGIAIDKTTA